MEYSPKCPQPFTLGQAIALDPEVASDEIARLQNSILHLKHTQDELQDYMEDPDVRQAVEENDATIASQDERIFMLKLALTHHGISLANKDDLRSVSSVWDNTSGYLNSNSTSVGLTNEGSHRQAEDDDGVYL
ncbi:hypothetical protein V8B97DRAFT_75221 [Scleroderma yunnanense]